MKCILIDESDRKNLKSFEFDKEEITIGRIVGNDLVINDVGVSRNHAKIISNEGTFELIDLDSRNGIEHNGQKVKSALLNDQDIIEIGNVSLKFCCKELSMSSALDETLIAPKGGLKGIKVDNLVGNLADPIKGLLKKKPTEKEKLTEDSDNAEGYVSKFVPLIRKPIVLVSAGILLLIVIFLSIGGDETGKTGKELTNIPDNSNVLIPVPGKGQYGNFASDRTHVDKAMFSFNWNKGKVLLSYEAAGATSGEIDLLLNGQKLNSVPSTNSFIQIKSERLPSESLKHGRNVLVFDNVKNAEGSPPGKDRSETWGIRNVILDTKDYPPCDIDLFLENLNRAALKYKEKKISFRNLYDSLINYQRAVDYGMECETKPERYEEAVEGLGMVKQELQDEYTARLFAAQQASKTNDWDRVRREMEDILKIIPDPDDHRYQKANKNLINVR